MLLAFVAACTTRAPAKPWHVSDGRYAMGTVLEIELYGADAAKTAEALESAFALAAELDRRMTVYDPGSDVSRLNRAAGGGPQPVHPDVASLLALSRDYALLTGGAFDVTIGPLVELWSEAAARDAAPSDAERARARALVGSEQIRVHAGARAEILSVGAAVNLGGIAKGYALDRMLPRLRELGVDRALLSFGQSSTWALGIPST